jgi:hypothetical protein
MRGIGAGSLVVLGWLLGAGCAHRVPGDTSGTPPLLATVQAETFPDSVHFVLQVTNTTDEPLTLHYSSGQSFDFSVRRAGRVVWRWSDGMMFTQAMKEGTLAPGETKRYDASWKPAPGAEGEYTVTGELTDRENRTAQTAAFRLP